MISGKYELTIALKEQPYPLPELLPGAENVEMPPSDKIKEFAMNAKNFTHYVEFSEQDGVLKGVHQTELSKQLVDDITEGNNTVSWKAYSGSEGEDLWHYSMVYSSVSNDTAGVCFGLEPFFRGYMVFYGRKID